LSISCANLIAFLGGRISFVFGCNHFFILGKRKALRLTQQEVADRAKITLRQYQRLESGERNIMTSSFRLACRVIEALDMDASKFYHGDYYLGEELKTIDGRLCYKKTGQPIDEYE